MKQSLIFLTRLSILNFIFFALIATFFLNNQKATTGINPASGKTKVNESPTSINSPNMNVQQKQNTSTEETPIPSTVITPDMSTQLSNHNSMGNCWISYEGNNYDITSFFGSHPGGDNIMLKYCGQDATSAFNSKDKNPPIPHSGSAKSMLAPFLVK